MDKIQSKININKMLDSLIQYAIDSNVLYYDSIDSYYSRKEQSIRRKIKFYLTYLLMSILTVKYGLLLICRDQLMWTPMKDATMVFGDQAFLLHAMLFGLSLLTISAKAMFNHCEIRSKMKFYDIVVNWQQGNFNYQISKQHLKSMTLKTFILYYVLIRIIGFIAMSITILITAILTMLTYLYCDYGNVIFLCLWTIIVILALKHMIIL